jgi:hypothetical protein
MVAVGNKETNLVAMVAVKANSVKSLFDSHSISNARQCRKGKARICNYYCNQYHEGILEIASSFLKILTNQMVDKTMVAVVKL